MGSIVKAVRQPIVWAPLLALVLALLGLEIPKVLKSSFNLLGSVAGGLALFAVGIKLYSQKMIISPAVIVNVCAKMIVLPAAILAMMIAFAVPQLQMSVVSVTLALPAAATAVIFAVEYKVGEQEMGSTLFWNNILCLFTIGGFIWVTS